MISNFSLDDNMCSLSEWSRSAHPGQSKELTSLPLFLPEASADYIDIHHSAKSLVEGTLDIKAHIPKANLTS